MKDAITKIVLGLILGVILWFTGYHAGENHEKSSHVVQVQKANDKVIKQNDDMQKAAEKEVQIQIVYKDRIVTQYQTVTKEIVKYEETPASRVVLDSDFVRLHNAAAADSETQTTGSTGSADGADQTAPVTTGEAISVIADNYKSFYECKAKVEGWQRFYADLQRTMNE